MNYSMKNNNVSDQTQYNTIDLIKFLCAIAVCLIHVPVFPDEPTKLMLYINFGFKNYLCRIAVPFFFTVSGFLLFRKMELYEPNESVIRNYCFKMLRFIGIWYILLTIGGTVQLWYLGGTVVAVILLSLCLRFRLRLSTIGLIACLLYAVGLFGDAYYGFVEPLRGIPLIRYIFILYEFFFVTTRNGVFMGFLFVFMGAILAHSKFKISLLAAATGFCISMLLGFAEAYLLQSNGIPAEHNMYLFIPPAVFFLFLLARDIHLPDHWIYKKLRIWGILIFFLHMYINQAVVFFSGILANRTGIELAPYRCGLVIMITFSLSVLLEWTSQKEHFKWLQFLYS